MMEDEIPAPEVNLSSAPGEYNIVWPAAGSQTIDSGDPAQRWVSVRALVRETPDKLVCVWQRGPENRIAEYETVALEATQYWIDNVRSGLIEFRAFLIESAFTRWVAQGKFREGELRKYRTRLADGSSFLMLFFLISENTYRVLAREEQYGIWNGIGSLLNGALMSGQNGAKLAQIGGNENYDLADEDTFEEIPLEELLVKSNEIG